MTEYAIRLYIIVAKNKIENSEIKFVGREVGGHNAYTLNKHFSDAHLARAHLQRFDEAF